MIDSGAEEKANSLFHSRKVRCHGECIASYSEVEPSPHLLYWLL